MKKNRASIRAPRPSKLIFQNRLVALLVIGVLSLGVIYVQNSDSTVLFAPGNKVTSTSPGTIQCLESTTVPLSGDPVSFGLYEVQDCDDKLYGGKLTSAEALQVCRGELRRQGRWYQPLIDSALAACLSKKYDPNSFGYSCGSLLCGNPPAPIRCAMLPSVTNIRCNNIVLGSDVIDFKPVDDNCEDDGRVTCTGSVVMWATGEGRITCGGCAEH